jgi:hypothetical protein
MKHSKMSSSIFRTESSSVVPLKSGEFLEVRRGNLRGSSIPDPMRWESLEAWLSSVNETLVDEPKRSEDISFLLKISDGRLGSMRVINNKKHEILEYRHNLAILNKDKEYLMYIKPIFSMFYCIPYRYTRYIVPKEVTNYTTEITIDNIQYEKYVSHISNKILELTTKLTAAEDTYAVLRRNPNFTLYKASGIYASCSDGVVRPIYYNKKYDKMGIYDGEKGVVSGRTFAELGIVPIGWFKMGPYNLYPIPVSESSSS